MMINCIPVELYGKINSHLVDYIKVFVVGIHSANNLLDTNPLGCGMRHHKHRQEACSIHFFFCFVGCQSSIHSSQYPQNGGTQQLFYCVFPNKHLLSFITDSWGTPLIMLILAPKMENEHKVLILRVSSSTN